MDQGVLVTDDQRGTTVRGVKPTWRWARRFFAALGTLLAAMIALPVIAHAATISGTAFEDFNDNGVRDTAPMIDAGVAGIAVTAYGADGAVLAQTRTAADGSYSLTLTDNVGPVRLEFTDLPAGYQPARHGPQSRTTVQFVNVTTGDISGVDVGVLQPANYCQDNPLLAIACAHYAAHDGDHSDDAAIRILAEGTPDQTAPDALGSGVQLPGEITGATFGQVGTIFGTAQPQGSGMLYTAAYAKRHADWGPGGPGAIYRTDVELAKKGTPNATLFFDVNTLPSQPAGTATRATGDWIRDGDAFDIAGNRSLGNLVNDPAGETLYTVGLATGELIRIPIPADGSSPAPSDVSVYPVPRDACANPDDARPMAVGFHKSGLLYVGGVCSMASVGDPMPQPATEDLAIFVYSFDPATGSFSSAPVLYSPLDADRLCINRPGGFPNEVCAAGRADADWHPWTSERVEPEVTLYYSQPMLTDIDFDGDDLILGIRDRSGDQAGYDTERADGLNNERVMSAGYTLRACLVDGVLELESGGKCGDRVGSGLAATPKYGPGDGLFYWDQLYGWDPDRSSTGTHDYGGLGGLLTIPGYPTLRQTHQNPLTECPQWLSDLGENGCPTFPGPHTSAGVLYMDHSDGARSKGFTMYLHDYSSQNSSFGKANGLGDLEALCDSAPIEIGNFVWVDSDRDGVQDPDEPAIPGVIVELVDKDGNVIATTTTDENGEYYFNDGNVPGGIDPDTEYTVRIPLDQEALKDYVPTRPNAGSPLHDSNGVPEGRYVVDRFRTGGPGHNDHTHDFGFYLPFNVSITKEAAAERVPLGGTVVYRLTVTNHGPGTSSPTTVTDPVPGRLRADRALASKGECAVDGNNVNCSLSKLAPGESVRVRVVATAIRAGRTVNGAVVVAPGDDDPRDNRDRARVVVNKGKLGLAKRVNRKMVRGGQLARFTILVRNPGRVALRGVRTCDRLPGGVEFVRANPRARFVRGQVCWTERILRPKQTKRYRVVVRAFKRTSGRKINRAVATARDARSARAKRAITIIRNVTRPISGGVTG